MKIGFVVEGATDIIFFRSLFRDLDAMIIPTNGPIKEKARALGLALVHSGCTHLVYIPDTDGKKKLKIRLINKKISKLPIFISGCVKIVTPDPHLECWFFKEEKALRKIFCLDATTQIPHPTIRSFKDRLNTIYGEWSKSTPELDTLSDVYQKIGESIDKDMLSKLDREFNDMIIFLDPATRGHR